MFAKQEDRAAGGRREMQIVAVTRSCAGRSSLHSLEKRGLLVQMCDRRRKDDFKDVINYASYARELC